MLTCSKCGTKNPTGKFCSECGTKLPTGTKACSACHNQIPAGAKFCPHCQADLQFTYLTFTDSEISYLKRLFHDSRLNNGYPQPKVEFTVRESETLKERIPDSYPNEQVIVEIPGSGTHILRYGAALDKIVFNGKERRGALIITNHRFVFLDPQRRKEVDTYLLYGNIQRYDHKGAAKNFTVELGTYKGNKLVFHFATPARGAMSSLLSAVSSESSFEGDQNDKAGNDFQKAISELLALLKKRWG